MPDSTTYRRLLGRLKLRHFALLRELGDVGNLRQAAMRLQMTQPAASKLLAEIEAAVAAPLFTRSRRGMSPTPTGMEAVRWSRVLMADFDAACRELDAITSGASGRLRIGVFPVASPALVPDAVATLARRWPALAITLQEGSEERLIPALLNGELDAVVGRLVPDTLSDGLAHEVLYDEPTRIVVGHSHLLAQRPALPVAALGRYRWVLPSASGSLFEILARWLREAGCEPPRVAIESPVPATTVAMLARDDFVTAFPHSQAARFEALGLVKVLDFKVPAPHHPVTLAWRKNVTHSPMLKALRETLQQHAKGMGAHADSLNEARQ